VETATDRLAALDDTEPEPADDPLHDPMEDGGSRERAPLTSGPSPEPPRESLARQRWEAVLAALRGTGAGSVVDLGCGEGKLLKLLLQERAFRRILGVDVSARSLEIAARRLRLDQLPDRDRARIALRQSSLTYRDAELAGFDAAVLMEVIEHVDPPRRPALERTVFGAARPGAVVVTTPNVEHNVRFGLEPGRTRHPDHRFEWTREQFRAWATGVAQRFGYAVEFAPVGPDDPEVGAPTQLALFTLAKGAPA
jgi:3' terminal RNA ribose 2'-O-methyltransferase Hen1